MNHAEMPEQVRGFCYVLLGGDDGKKPIEKGWQKKRITLMDESFRNHIKNGNYGILCGNASPVRHNGEMKPLIGVDFDNEQFQNEIMSKLPETFTVKTGGKGLYHLYFASDDSKSFKIHDEKMATLADVQGEGKQLVAPGSINTKTGRAYEVVKNVPIAFISYAELKALLDPYNKAPKKADKPKKDFVAKGFDRTQTEEIINAVSMREVLEEVGVNTNLNPTNCPFHTSAGGKCLGWNDQTAHCFHCEGSWNRYSILKEAKRFTDKQTFEWFAEKGGNMDKLKASRKEYVQEKKKEIDFSIEAALDAFLDKYPMFYDRAKILWKWDSEKYMWEQIDFTDLGIAMSDANKSSLKEHFNEFLERARLRIPQNPEPTWIQFKSKVYDFATGKSFPASPKYFMTNPIPFDLGDNDNTPNIDRLFTEWVGDNYKQTLYEIVAYNMTPNKFMQRLIALVGGGSNGKSTFMSLNQRLLGTKNYVSSELKLLAERNFETAILYKKLLCIIGEVSYDDLTNTSQLKKLSGEDDIRFEFKGKQPFSDKNTSTIMCLTNSLPRTPDRSMGFYRRWLIVDFPNQFAIGKNPIESISDNEMKCLAKKCYDILKALYSSRKFTNEGTYEERERIYEEKSNPITLFIAEKCEDTPGQHITKRDFHDGFNEWLRIRHQRPLSAHQITKMLKAESYDVGSRKVDGESTQVIVNLSYKDKVTINTINTAKNPTNSPPIATNLKTASNYGNYGNSDISGRPDQLISEADILAELEQQPNCCGSEFLENGEKFVCGQLWASGLRKLCNKCRSNQDV